MVARQRDEEVVDFGFKSELFAQFTPGRLRMSVSRALRRITAHGNTARFERAVTTLQPSPVALRCLARLRSLQKYGHGHAFVGDTRDEDEGFPAIPAGNQQPTDVQLNLAPPFRERIRRLLAEAASG